MSRNNILTMRLDEADKVLRRRREQAAKDVVKIKKVGAAVSMAAHYRAFQAVIMFYESNGDQGMADLLRLDLDRFTRRRKAKQMLIRPEERTA